MTTSFSGVEAAGLPSALLGRLLKLHNLIISHQVSPVSTGLHPDGKYTHIFPPDPLPPPPPSPPGCCRNANRWMCRAESIRDARTGQTSVSYVGCPGVFEACMHVCVCVCNWASWCVAISVQEADEGQQIRGGDTESCSGPQKYHIVLVSVSKCPTFHK